FGYFAGVLTQQAVWNAVFHAGTTVAWREYSPGLWTALAQLPLWLHLSRAARREQLLTGSGVRAAAVIGGVIHAAAAWQLFRPRPRRPPSAAAATASRAASARAARAATSSNGPT